MKYCALVNPAELPPEFANPETTDDDKFKQWLLDQLMHPCDNTALVKYPLCIDKPFPANQKYDEKVWIRLRKQALIEGGIKTPSSNNINNNIENNTTDKEKPNNNNKKRAPESKQRPSEPAPKKAKTNKNNAKKSSDNGQKNNTNANADAPNQPEQPRRSTRIKTQNENRKWLQRIHEPFIINKATRN